MVSGEWGREGDVLCEVLWFCAEVEAEAEMWEFAVDGGAVVEDEGRFEWREVEAWVDIMDRWLVVRYEVKLGSDVDYIGRALENWFINGEMLLGRERLRLQ